jgi:phosphomevalonate kinase
MNENQNNKIITKSPGKSLLSGGYLILDKTKMGLVLNIDAYIKCESEFIINANKKEKNYLYFNIFSEYLKQYFYYSVYIDFNKNKEIQISEKNNQDNKWIKNCIISSLIFYICQNNASKVLFNSEKSIEINVNIKSDYKFYSYSPDKISQNIKTGLGSSSAFINSLTSNLILIYEYLCKNKNYPKNSIIKNIDDKNFQAMILGSCLLSNNLSQNKIGSCFDIISSLFGSQIFIQVQNNIFLNSPFNLNSETISKINNLLEYLKTSYIPNILYLNENNKYLQNKIFFISIEIGSDTRIFVKKVLEYANKKKKNKLYDDELFTQLNELNENIINIILKDFNKDKDYILLKENCIKYRSILRKLSEESKVDIEPNILTPLLDDLINLNDIIYAICPGAGGYDSIIIMAKENTNKSDLIKKINDLIDKFNRENKDKKLDIKANLLDVNISKNPGTIIL